MYVTRHPAQQRRGVILLVVLSMLTLFAIVGISFVFYADAEASASRVYREAQDLTRPDVDPEFAFAYFLSQLIYDVDDTYGVGSALRGHSLTRNTYGYNPGATNDLPYSGIGRLHVPTGTAANLYGNPWNLDDYYLINYTYFGTLEQQANKLFLRDPERLGTRVRPSDAQTNPFVGSSVSYTYPDLNNMFLAVVDRDGRVLMPSFHRDYSTSNPPVPTFGSLDPNNPNWKIPSTGAGANPALKYMVLRPRPIDHAKDANGNPLFPYPEDAGGDVKNLIGAPGGNDSIWIDIGAPVMKTPDGKKYKMLVAPLILDLDGRINLNVHGNVMGPADARGNPTHASNQGWGPWEVNLGKVLTKNDTNGNPEWPQLFKGLNVNVGPNKSLLWGRYGPDQQPNNQNGVAANSRVPHFYAQVNFNGARNPTLGTAANDRIQLPTGLTCFPTFSDRRYYNGTNQVAYSERKNHALRYNVFRAVTTNPTANDDRVFSASNMERVLRYGDTGNDAMTSELFRLLPQNLGTQALSNDRSILQMITTHSFDLERPGLVPWIYDPTAVPLGILPTDPEGAPGVAPTAQPGAMPFPALANRQGNPPALSEFDPQSWRANAAYIGTLLSQRVDLNRTLPPFPHQGRNANGLNPLVTANERFDKPVGGVSPDNYVNIQGNPYNPVAGQYVMALQARQNFANDIYRALLAITGLRPVGNAVNPSDADLQPRRWLAQLAVNIVDFIDEDDISTPFNFYTAQDAGNPAFDIGAGITGKDNQTGAYPNPEAQWPKYWVFGTELPRVLINEVMAQSSRQVDPTTGYTDNVRAFVELVNAFPATFSNTPLQAGTVQQPDRLPVPLTMEQSTQTYTGALNNAQNPYGTYRIVLADLFPPQGAPASVGPLHGYPLNDNVLGNPPDPTLVRSVTNDADFTTANQTKLIKDGTTPQPNSNLSNPPTQAPYVVAQPNQPQPIDDHGFFLLGPKPDPNQADPNKFNARDPFTVANSTNNIIPGNTPLLRTDSLQYGRIFPAPGMGVPLDERTHGLSVVLRRLANPHLPYNPKRANQLADGTWVPNPWYNPYVTVDYMDRVQIFPTLNPADQTIRSWGRRQPYAADATQGFLQQTQVTAPNLYHTFGTLNNPPPQAGAQALPYNWLVHLDRQLTSPTELLQVSGFQPYQLTHRFIMPSAGGAVPYSHRAPWLDQSRRLYRFFELVQTHDRSQGVTDTARVPGRININTIGWRMQEIFQAICDGGDPNDPQNPNYFYDTQTQSDVVTTFQNMIKQRHPGLAQNPPTLFTAYDRPFKSFMTGVTLPNDPQYPTPQSTTGSGIEDTLLRSNSPNLSGTFQTQRLFQLPGPNVPADPNQPYLHDQLLNKIFSNLTTRSNVFAVWATIGFFEVTDDTTQPPTLGAEMGRAEGRHVRHRMFAIVDRTQVGNTSTPLQAAITGPGQATISLRLSPNPVTVGPTGSFPIQAGSVVQVGTGANAELVYVTAVTPYQAMPPTAATFTATFSQAHAQGATISYRRNPGPPARFNPHNSAGVVPYFSVID
jgi:hypothetical protein